MTSTHQSALSSVRESERASYLMIWTPWQVSPLRQIKTPARTMARRPETVCVGVKTMHQRLWFLSGESDQNAKVRPPPSLCGVLRQRCLSSAGHFHRSVLLLLLLLVVGAPLHAADCHALHQIDTAPRWQLICMLRCSKDSGSRKQHL